MNCDSPSEYKGPGFDQACHSRVFPLSLAKRLQGRDKCADTRAEEVTGPRQFTDNGRNGKNHVWSVALGQILASSGVVCVGATQEGKDQDRRDLQVQPIAASIVGAGIAAGSGGAAGQSFIGNFNRLHRTTVWINGDENPYGVASVPITKANLSKVKPVSNFNNSGNLQGTGTTIVEMTKDGNQTLFAQIDPTKVTCPGGVGLTTALVALRSGYVVVGSLPTTDGMSDTIGAGCLLILDWNGDVVQTIVGHHINGPWDMTAVDGDDAGCSICHQCSQRHSGWRRQQSCVQGLSGSLLCCLRFRITATRGCRKHGDQDDFLENWTRALVIGPNGRYSITSREFST